MQSVLIANRGEIALRIQRAASVLGLRTVAIYTKDESDSRHIGAADTAFQLSGEGAQAYLEAAEIISIARQAGCSMIHPGYGFLSENADFAEACGAAGVTFVGPDASVLRLFGDKMKTRRLARDCGVPVLPATEGVTTPGDAVDFYRSLGPGAAVMIKAVAGGGGRGMRTAFREEDIPEALERCRSEAFRAFGNGETYLEQLLPAARHIEVQIIGDGAGGLAHLWDRECSLQRQHQKLIEMAPADLPTRTREALIAAALKMAAEAGYASLGTFEFLVDSQDQSRFYFIEANPRLQVEHPVTEAVTGVDLVAAQLRIARGETLAGMGLEQARIPVPQGIAVEARVNLEELRPDGNVWPTSGEITSFGPPALPDVRIDTHGFEGMTVSGGFDSLLAKVIITDPGGNFTAALERLDHSLARFRVEGPDTNIALLRKIIGHRLVRGRNFTTRFVDEHLAELVGGTPEGNGSEGAAAVLAPVRGTIVAVLAAAGDLVRRGDPLAVLEAMKMEHMLCAPHTGRVLEIMVSEADMVIDGATIAIVEAVEHGQGSLPSGVEAAGSEDLSVIRPDLREVMDRHDRVLDEARPAAVKRRHGSGRRTARENMADLFDDGSFTEYGALTIAAQRQRRSLEDLIENTPADGLVAGTGRVNTSMFGRDAAQIIAMSYDYTVLAGTQGTQNHKKAERLFDLARRRRLPMVIFAEGGGGRPGDTDNMAKASGMDLPTFVALGRLNGLVPTVGIAAGRCFAGNAALLGCCDVVIATADSNIGMGGPAMIEGGGLGKHLPEDIGPLCVQSANGVVDISVTDEEDAVRAAGKYLSYFQGAVSEFTCEDQRRLRSAIPENRVRIYEVRNVIDLLADTASVLELRAGFGRSIVTALVRIEGRPMGIVANDPAHLGGALDSDAADKMARFLQLCDAHGLPIITLCDTPGFMVGPEAETTASVRHFSRLFVTAPNLTVPICTVILRKGYGLGAQAMAGGSFKVPVATVAWPTAELGAMGFEGAVQLGYRHELEAITDPAKRRERFQTLLENYQEQGKAVHAASVFEIDDVIDPALTRSWVVNAFTGAGASTTEPSPGRRRFIDTW
jgi:acetyl/propionyl-CoA carboxylase alpha subunit